MSNGEIPTRRKVLAAKYLSGEMSSGEMFTWKKVQSGEMSGGEISGHLAYARTDVDKTERTACSRMINNVSNAVSELFPQNVIQYVKFG